MTILASRKEMTKMGPIEKKDWIVQFLNLPSKDQVQFLYRMEFEESIRKEIERKVFGEEFEQP
jgi:hypothetical protein